MLEDQLESLAEREGAAHVMGYIEAVTEMIGQIDRDILNTVDDMLVMSDLVPFDGLSVPPENIFGCVEPEALVGTPERSE